MEASKTPTAKRDSDASALPNGARTDHGSVSGSALAERDAEMPEAKRTGNEGTLSRPIRVADKA